MHINVKPAALGERPFEVSKVQRQRPLRGGRVWGMAVATLRGMAPPRLDPALSNRANRRERHIHPGRRRGGRRPRPDGADAEADGIPPRSARPRRLPHRAPDPLRSRDQRRRPLRYGLRPDGRAAYFDAHDGTPLYVVPVLGPLFAIPKKTGQPCDGGDQNICVDFDELVTAFFIADAVIQATGLVMAWRGFAGREVLMRDEAPKATLLPGPIGGTGYGAWLTGRF